MSGFFTSDDEKGKIMFFLAALKALDLYAGEKLSGSTVAF